MSTGKGIKNPPARPKTRPAKTEGRKEREQERKALRRENLRRVEACLDLWDPAFSFYEECSLSRKADKLAADIQHEALAQPEDAVLNLCTRLLDAVSIALRTHREHDEYTARVRALRAACHALDPLFMSRRRNEANGIRVDAMPNVDQPDRAKRFLEWVAHAFKIARPPGRPIPNEIPPHLAWELARFVCNGLYELRPSWNEKLPDVERELSAWLCTYFKFEKPTPEGIAVKALELAGMSHVRAENFIRPRKGGT